MTLKIGLHIANKGVLSSAINVYFINYEIILLKYVKWIYLVILPLDHKKAVLQLVSHSLQHFTKIFTR